MSVIEMNCPQCGAVLKVPEEAIGKKGRCRLCNAKFTIAPPIDVDEPADSTGVAEDMVSDWLNAGPPLAEAFAAGANDQKNAAAGKKNATATAEKKHFEIKLDHVDTMGAFFRFDSMLLEDSGFRGALPQRCIVCGSRKDLLIHLIVWSSKLADRQRGENQSAASAVVLNLEEFSGMECEQMLAELPVQENIPEPYCLPFPYYVCPSCSAVGAIVTDVHPGRGPRSEECELGICSLLQAEKFALAVCGPEAPGLKEIRTARKERKGDSWQQLPLAIRVKIQRWYKPQKGEKFLAYFCDADYSKAEAGLAGIVLTDHRLVYHKNVALSEFPLSKSIAVNSTKKGANVNLEIKPASGKSAKLTVLSADAEAFQRLLRKHARFTPR